MLYYIGIVYSVVSYTIIKGSETMTKHVRITSILASAISQLYTICLLALGVATAMTSVTGTDIGGWLFYVDYVYSDLATSMGISTLTFIILFNLSPVAVLEILAIVLTNSKKVSVRRAMAVTITLILMACSVLWCIVAYVSSTPMQALWICVLLCLPAFFMLILCCIMLVGGSKVATVAVEASEDAEQSADMTTDNAVEQEQCATTEQETVNTAPQEEQSVQQSVAVSDNAEEPVSDNEVHSDITSELEVAVECADSQQLDIPATEPTVIEEHVDTLPAEQQEPTDVQTDTVSMPTVDVPYQPVELRTTADVVSSVYGTIDNDAPPTSAMLAKLDKLSQYRDMGIITTAEYDKLCSSVLADVD